MKDAIRHLDQRFMTLRPLASAARPPKGWIRAIRDALGMTTTQLAQRLGVSQSRIPELEKAETTGQVTMQSLDRAAQALGCRLVYALVPEKPLEEMINERIEKFIRQNKEHVKSVDQTMLLENQDTKNGSFHERKMLEEIERRPQRLWDEP